MRTRIASLAALVLLGAGPIAAQPTPAEQIPDVARFPRRP